MEKTVIDLDKADFSFTETVINTHGGRNLRNCYACGSCSAVCQVLPLHEGYDPRRIIRLILFGQKEKVLNEPMIWQCSTCVNCEEVCPQGVDFMEISFELKNMATEIGQSPAGMTAQLDLLSSHGRLYEITEFENEKRVKLNLPEIEEKPEDFKIMLAETTNRLESKKKTKTSAGEAD